MSHSPRIERASELVASECAIKIKGSHSIHCTLHTTLYTLTNWGPKQRRPAIANASKLSEPFAHTMRTFFLVLSIEHSPNQALCWQQSKFPSQRYTQAYERLCYDKPTGQIRCQPSTQSRFNAFVATCTQERHR